MTTRDIILKKAMLLDEPARPEFIQFMDFLIRRYTQPSDGVSEQQWSEFSSGRIAVDEEGELYRSPRYRETWR